VTAELFGGEQGGDSSIRKIGGWQSLEYTERILHGVGMGHGWVHGLADGNQGSRGGDGGECGADHGVMLTRELVCGAGVRWVLCRSGGYQRECENDFL